jgi:hypothetical protein
MWVGILHAPHRAVRLIYLAALALVACALNDERTESSSEEDALDEVVLSLPDETGAAGPVVPLDAAATDLLDVRGVGDSAFCNTHESDPLPAQFGKALDRFDPSGHSYRGDLSFINWESVVGDRCDKFSKPYVPGQSYAFISRPANLAQAYARGFNLVGLSNNHSRDCSNGGGEGTSSKLTAPALEAMPNAWLWAGVSTSQADVRRAKVRTFTIKGRPVRVAFASVYTGRASCPLASCQDDAKAIMASLRDAAADLRILALHSQDSQPKLVATGTAFIRDYGGDVVFGHGPHVYKPVHVVRKPNGAAGVMFESLGNFLHPACAAQTKNYIGRALFDPASMRLRQVQLIPVANSGLDVHLSAVDARKVASNLRWTAAPEIHGVYANVRP